MTEVETVAAAIKAVGEKMTIDGDYWESLAMAAIEAMAPHASDLKLTHEVVK